MPFFTRNRGRSRSPSLPIIKQKDINTEPCFTSGSQSLFYLQVPQLKKERSYSLDMTSKKMQLIGRSQSGTPTSSAASSSVSLADLTEHEVKESRRGRSPRLSLSSNKSSGEYGVCLHCEYLEIITKRAETNRLMRQDSQTQSDSSDKESDAESDDGQMQTLTQREASPLTQSDEYYSNSQNQCITQSSSYKRKLTRTSSMSDSSDLSGSRHTSCASFERTPSPLALSYPTPQPALFIDEAGDDDAFSPFYEAARPELLNYINHNNNNPSFSLDDCRRKPKTSHLYKNVITLQVPAPFIELQESNSTPVSPSEPREPREHGDRRASLDDRMITLYHSFQKMPSNLKQAVRRTADSDPTDTQLDQKAIYQRSHISSQSCEGEIETLTRKLDDDTKVDWSENAIDGAHIWQDYANGESCYLDDNSCVLCGRAGSRKKCCACHMISHVACISHLENNGSCKPTFREAGVRNYREQRTTLHHWIHRKRQEGRCKACGKSFPQKNFFQSTKEVIAVGCSWCHIAYHNKPSCFSSKHFEEPCTLGEFGNVIIPPSWIIKISRKLAYKSSVKKLNKRASRKRMSMSPQPSTLENNGLDFKPFIIKPMPISNKKPLIVFVNPRSGGNQGSRLIRKFNFYLNPRQVFDLSVSGPQHGLELYKKVNNLHVLVCGGDGTAGWVLAEIDKIGFITPPAVAVLPLGTGNDLARTLNWGSGYADEPITKVLNQIEDSQQVMLDRWDISTEPITEADKSESNHEETSSLPISVINNYFSIGADAHILMEFHESREANPEKFNSRFRNKMFFAGAGGKDLIKKAWKDLVDHIKIECDGSDITERIQELKLHCLLFLNIPNYSSGTDPWGNTTHGYDTPRHDDGRLEVIGFTTTQLATLQVGGHGEKICQCHHVKITTQKTIPMQIDGEPCRLLPSVIEIKLRNQARMLMKQKKYNTTQLSAFKDTSLNANRMRLQVSRISLMDYEKYHYDKEKLKEISIPLGIIAVNRQADLEMVREEINRLGKEMCKSPFNSYININDSPSKSPPSTQRSSLNSATSDQDSSPDTRRKTSHDSIASDSSMLSRVPAPCLQPLSSKWTFLDSTTAVRFFRIDRGQEHLHYITDISSEDLFILDPDLITPVEAGDLQRQFSGVSGDYKYPVTPPRSPLVDGRERMTSADKALIDAAKRGDLKRFSEAHQKGANIMRTDGDGMTALHNAARFNYKDIAQYIIKNAPKEIIDMLDKEKGQTALHKAAWYQRRTICRMLVHAGSDLSIKDKQSNTAKSQALRAEDLELANFLEYQEMLTRQTFTQV